MAVMPNGQKYPDIKGQAQPPIQLTSASQQSIKPNKSAVLEPEPNCSIDLNLAVIYMA